MNPDWRGALISRDIGTSEEYFVAGAQLAYTINKTIIPGRISYDILYF